MEEELEAAKAELTAALEAVRLAECQVAAATLERQQLERQRAKEATEDGAAALAPAAPALVPPGQPQQGSTPTGYRIPPQEELAEVLRCVQGSGLWQQLQLHGVLPLDLSGRPAPAPGETSVVPLAGQEAADASMADEEEEPEEQEEDQDALERLDRAELLAKLKADRERRQARAKRLAAGKISSKKVDKSRGA